MPFEPQVGDTLEIDGQRYAFAEHPAAPGITYGQEGRAGTVYCLTLTPPPGPLPSPARRERGGGAAAGGGGGVRAALKVFKPRFRLPYLVSQAERIASFATLPGLAACRRTVLTPFRQPDLLRQYPDLTYAVLMPWIEGPTWQEVLLDKNPLSPEQSLALARGLAEALARMEEQGIAHCDLSAPNVMLPALALTPTPGGFAATPFPSPAGGRGEGGRGDGVRAPVQLVDLEGLYAPGMVRPQELSSGSAGYAHRQAAGGLWSPDADRFAGAVLLAEMLGFCDRQVVDACWGETYFDPREMQQDCPRYRTLLGALRRTWGEGVAALFERAWRSDTLADCPTFGEWLVALPLTPSPRPLQAGIPLPLSRRAGEGEGDQGVGVRADLTRAQVQALMQAARQLEERGNLDGALEVYRQAYELTANNPALASVGREIALVIQSLEEQQSPVPPPLPPALSQPIAASPTPSAQKLCASPVQKLHSVVLRFLQITDLKTILGWALATLTGWSLYGAIEALLFLALGSRRLFMSSRANFAFYLTLTGALAGIVGGAMVGVGQWWILRSHIRRINEWVWTGIISLAAGGIIRWALYALRVEGYHIICWAVIGAAVSTVQWMLLRPHIRYIGWWIPFQAIAFTAGWAVAIGPTHWGLYQIYTFYLRSSFLPSAAGGMIVGILTVLWLRYTLHRYDHLSTGWMLPIVLGLIGLGFLGDPRSRSAYQLVTRLVRVDWSFYQVVIGVICGTMVGAGQWLLLRTHIRWAIIWMPLTGVALAIVEGTIERIYVTLHLSIISPLYLLTNWTLYFALYWAMVSIAIGFTGGIGVWLTLRWRVPMASRRIASSILSLSIAGAVVSTIILSMRINGVISGAMAGITVGLPTGIAMRLLLWQSKVHRKER